MYLDFIFILYRTDINIIYILATAQQDSLFFEIVLSWQSKYEAYSPKPIFKNNNVINISF